MFNQSKSNPPDYVIVIDMDILGWDINGIADSMGQSTITNWGVICANGILAHGIYRDTYAFRMENINTNHHRTGADYQIYNITREEKRVFRHSLKVFLLYFQFNNLSIYQFTYQIIRKIKN